MTPYCDHAVPMAIQCKQCDAEELEKLRTDRARLQAENALQEGLLQRAMKTMSAMICAHPVDRQRMADEFYDEWASAKTRSDDISQPPTPSAPQETEEKGKP